MEHHNSAEYISLLSSQKPFIHAAPLNNNTHPQRGVGSERWWLTC